MNRCPFCGYPCTGKACKQHAALVRIEAAMRGDVHKRERYEATCPRCGTRTRNRKYCPDCRCELYPRDTFLASLTKGAK